jgi:elongation factor Ts
VVTASLVKELREQTGAGIMECKRALVETGGDLKKATDLLRQTGLAKADKKLGRAANQGLIETYVHAGGRIASMVELNCETDFVARTPDFKTLAREIAMQVAAMNPRYVSAELVPDGDWTEIEAEFGDRKKGAEAVCLYEQAFIRDPKRSINELIREGVAKLGENVQVQRFARFEVGADRPATEETE